MTTEEQKLQKSLLMGTASAADGLRLYSLMCGRGVEFPMEWEEKVLLLCLKEEPGRKDLTSRLGYVMKSLGKQVPEEILETQKLLAQEQEWGRDHQKDAFEYHMRTGLKDMDSAFYPIYERCRKYSMTSTERMYALYQATCYLADANISGAMVECGVWRGGSMMVVAEALLSKGVKDRDLYLFDTYEGLPKPDSEIDVDIWGNKAIDGWMPHALGDEKSNWANAGIEDVRANLLSTGYPEKHLHFIKGMVERTIPEKAPQTISLLRLDTDWYESTKHEMQHLYPRLVPNGTLIIDDYGHFRGARTAVDEYFSEHNVKGLLCRVDYSGRIMVKNAF